MAVALCEEIRVDVGGHSKTQQAGPSEAGPPRLTLELDELARQDESNRTSKWALTVATASAYLVQFPSPTTTNKGRSSFAAATLAIAETARALGFKPLGA